MTTTTVMTLNQPDGLGDPGPDSGNVSALPASVVMARPLVMEFNGCRLDAYPDPRGELWKIGWGSIVLANGKAICAGDKISQAQADRLLTAELVKNAHALASRITGWGQLLTNEQAALLSFTNDVGIEWYGHQAFAALSECLKTGLLVDDRALAGIPAALMLYVGLGGPCEAHLRRRRRAEGALWRAVES